MTEPEPDQPKGGITFTGPVKIAGDVATEIHRHTSFNLLDPNVISELGRLLEQIRTLQAQQGEGWSPQPLELPSTPSPDHQTPCAGRDTEAAELAQALRDRRHVEIYGPAGIGKSALLKHAAATGLLSVDTVPDCQGVVWLRWTCVTLADAVDEILRVCFDIRPTVPVGTVVARRLMRDVRALVIVDDVPTLSTQDIMTLLGLMPGSVFVVTSHQRRLSDGAVRSLPLGRLSWEVSRALLEGELHESLDDREVLLAEQFWDRWDGNPRQLWRLAGYMRQAMAHGKTEDRIPGDDALIVPRLVGWLPTEARATFDTLAAFGTTEWGQQLLAAVTGIPEEHGPAKLQALLAAGVRGRYRLSEDVAQYAAELDLVDLTQRITIWVRDAATPNMTAAEAAVIEQALHAVLEARQYPVALQLARAAARKLMLSSHWGAWGRVAALGLNAATRTGSLRDEMYFRYALIAGRMPEGKTEQTLEMLIAALNTGATGDELADVVRARKLSAEVQSAGDDPLSSAGQVAASLTPVARLASQDTPAEDTAPPGRLVQLISRTPGVNRALGPVVRLAAAHPTEFRAAVAAVVIGVSTLLASTAASPPPVAAAQMPPAPPATTTGTKATAQSPSSTATPDSSGNQPVPASAGAGTPTEHSQASAGAVTIAPTAAPAPIQTSSTALPTQQSKQDTHYTVAPDLTGHWRLVLHRSTGDDVYTTELVQLDQRKCPTAARCYGDPGKGWWHYDHIETNNIVITPTLAGDRILFTATEANSAGGTQYYDGHAPNDTTVIPMQFDGDWHVEPTSGPQQHATFTFTRIS